MDIPAFCTQCRSRCGCIASVEDGRLTAIRPAPAHPSGSRLCPKGRAAPELVYHPDRILHPMRRVSPRGETPARWQRITWAVALDEIADRMARIRDAHGPEQVVFSVTTPSGTHMSDGISWVERFIRAFGSPNTIYGTEICNWHKDYMSRLTFGWDIGTPDFARSDVILLWGHNPAATWLARSVEVQAAMKRGARLIVVDPRATTFARRADCWLRVGPGSDQVLALGLLHILLRNGGFDAGFARRWTNAGCLTRRDTGALLRGHDLGHELPDALVARGTDGGMVFYDPAARRWLGDPDAVDLFATGAEAPGQIPCRSVLAALRDITAPHDPASVAAVTGVPAADLHRAAEMLGAAQAPSYYCWNGIGQSETASQTDRALSILYALSGHYGQAGGNVPGAAAAFQDISGMDLITDAMRAHALGHAERPLGPGNQGWVTARDVYRAALDGAPYRVRALVSFGGNLLSAQPDPDLARDALGVLDLHVHADFFLNPTAELADIVLPVATSWEREGLRMGFDVSLEGLRRVQLRPAVIAPRGEARSDTDIALALARRLGLDGAMFGCDAEAGHAHALGPSGVTLNELRARPEGVEVAGEVRLRPHEEAGFPTPSGLVEIFSERLRDAGQLPLPEWQEGDAARAPPGYPVRLSCAKTVSFCHSQHRNIPSLRRLTPHPVIEIATDVAEARGIDDGAWVEVRTSAGRFVAQAKLAPDHAPGSVFAQHGWWAPGGEGAPYGADPMAASMNAAVDSTRADPLSGSIPLRAGWCDLGPL